MHITYVHTYMHKSITSCILSPVCVLGYGSLEKNDVGVDVAFLEVVSHGGGCGEAVRSKLLMLGLPGTTFTPCCLRNLM